MIVASSSRIRDEQREKSRYIFISESPSNMTVSTLIRTFATPLRLTVGGVQAEFQHDPDSGTVLVRYPGVPQGIKIILEW
jgi:hypothetical protein